MTLLENDAFLTELAKLYVKSRAGGNVVITMKRCKYSRFFPANVYNDGAVKPRTSATKSQENIDYKCFFRAKYRNEKISTTYDHILMLSNALVNQKDVNRFQLALFNVLKSKMDALKKRHFPAKTGARLRKLYFPVSDNSSCDKLRKFMLYILSEDAAFETKAVYLLQGFFVQGADLHFVQFLDVEEQSYKVIEADDAEIILNKMITESSNRTIRKVHKEKYCMLNDVFSFFRDNKPVCEVGNAKTDEPITNYTIVLVADLDHNSKASDKVWISYLQLGRFSLASDCHCLQVEWDPVRKELKGGIAQEGRAMELSDLARFQGQLITVDDRTGILYKIVNFTLPIPWLLLADGDGEQPKGFKAEWMTVKNGMLYVGGIGKEWTSVRGEYMNDNPMWIKIIDSESRVRHIFWKDIYIKLRAAVGIEYPGYMIHESVQWSQQWKRWFFLPRRASPLPYSEKEDERRAANVLLQASENFEHISATYLGEPSETRGFSAFQFIPKTLDKLIVAVKSEEIDGKVTSFLTIFDTNGVIILNDTEIPGHVKYEGIEFIV
ncbi:Soluble calcium-activated nucleotidase 1 [Trichinella spiralis]|uniref:Signal recognition particle 14 kDa protein n=1 Tax=Trichinella spiralis TaxID=6334 RepID=A0A0V1BL64_TRISP|nr:Soluble calcium-activated nucleotidase 1 [Trichinella spiralis]